MIDTLKDTLSKVNDWIKFAEAKNAANVAFCSAGIFAITRMIFSTESLHTLLLTYMCIVVFILVVSSALSLLSFIPQLKTPWVHIGNRDNDDNVLYFGHACKYSASTYLDKIYCGKSENAESYNLELLYAGQIVINSRVALVKFKQFDIAILCTLTAILSPLGGILVYKLKN